MILQAISPAENVHLNIVLGKTGDNLTVEYVTPNSNQPNKFGNQLYLWQADTVPWGQDFLQDKAITGATRQGSTVFKELSMGSKDYIIGYAVGAEMPASTSWVRWGNVCATAYLPKGIITDPDPVGKIDLFSTQIYPEVAADSINVSYEVTPGVQPKTNGAYMALWRSKTNPYLNPNIEHFVPISTDADKNDESFDDITLVSGATYTLAFMMSGWDAEAKKPKNQTSIAAVKTFKIV